MKNWSDKHTNLFRVAYKMLLNSKKKFIGMVLGAVVSSFIIMQQPSIYKGITDRLVAHIQYMTEVDLWVMGYGTPEFSTPSAFTPMDLYRIRNVPGVLWAIQIYRNSFNLFHPKTKQRMSWSFIGVDPDKLIGLPHTMIAGSRNSIYHANAIIVDGYSLKQMETATGQTIRVGDKLIDKRHVWTITGITKPLRNYESSPMAYVLSSHLPDLLSTKSFIIVKVKPSYDIHQVSAAIRAYMGWDALTPDEFSLHSKLFFREKTPIIIGYIVTAMIGYAIGLMIMLQIFNNFIVTHLHQFGMLKMLGASNRSLIEMVFFQVGIIGLLGYTIGLLQVILFGICTFDTMIAFHLTWQIALQGVLGIMITMLISGYVSVLKVVRLDTVELCRDQN